MGLCILCFTKFPPTSLVSIDSNFCLKQLLLLWWLPNGGFKKSAHICKLEIYYKEKCTFLLSICLTIIHSFICSSIHLYYYRLISYYTLWVIHYSIIPTLKLSHIWSVESPFKLAPEAFWHSPNILQSSIIFLYSGIAECSKFTFIFSQPRIWNQPFF